MGGTKPRGAQKGSPEKARAHNGARLKGHWGASSGAPLPPPPPSHLFRLVHAHVLLDHLRGGGGDGQAAREALVDGRQKVAHGVAL